MNFTEQQINSFWSRTKPEESGCILWAGYLNDRGYGSTGSIGGKTYRAHRFAYLITFGEIPAGAEIDHKCRNRSCVNPEHLQALPVLAHRKKDAPFKRRSHCKNGHAFSEENTYTHLGNRRCRACSLIRGRKHDGWKGGVHQSLRTHCTRGHELIEPNIRVAISQDKKHIRRVCRACELIRCEKYRASHRSQINRRFRERRS